MTKLRADFTRFRVLKAAFGPGLSPTWHPVPAVRQGLSPQSHPPASALSPQSQASPSLRLGTESPGPLKYLSLCVSLQSRAGLIVAWWPLFDGEGVLSAEPAVASSLGAAYLLELVRVRLGRLVDAVSLGTLTPPLARVDPRTSGGLCTERQTRKTVSAWEHYTTHKCGRARTANSMGLH